ncbi:hypothetical protein A8E99_33650 [Burkholderia cenocepacia]|nr:hypothetical protein A8E90_01315 [Burkholderia cenocepacia]ONW31471.1 hypothetical protein A8E99_33650 [Burkholderia cenocepacia]ONW67545.1 hypothetical protein A8E91_11310 [Burkholderia cenocepacia]
MVGSHGGHYSRGAKPLRGRTLREISRIAGRCARAAARRIGRSARSPESGAPARYNSVFDRRPAALHAPAAPFFPRRRALSGRAASPVRRIP